MEILKNSQFLKLWGNQILLQVAFNMCNFTALLLIEELTNSRFSLAIFYCAITLPAFLVGILAGSIVDISNRKKLMLATDLILVVLFFLYSLTYHNYSGLVAIAFFTSVAAQFFTPAESATIPLIVRGKSLEKANALFLFTGLGSVMIGYALAGPVIQYFGGLSGDGPRWAFIIASILTLGGLFLRLSFNTVETLKPLTSAAGIFIKTIILASEVILTARKNPKIYIPIGLLTLMELNIGLLAILFIDYVKEYLKLPATSTSYFLILPLIVGLGLGVVLMGQVEKFIGRGKSIFISSIIFGMVILTLGIAGRFLSEEISVLVLRIITAIGAVFVGIAAVFIATYSRTILQENTPENMLGRVFSLVTIGASAVAPIPILLISLITEKVDVATVFIIFGGLLVLYFSFYGKRFVAKIN